MKIMEWDIETGKKIKAVDGHNGDVAALSLKNEEEGVSNVFVTGSVDRTVRMTETRVFDRAAFCVAVFLPF